MPWNSDIEIVGFATPRGGAYGSPRIHVAPSAQSGCGVGFGLPQKEFIV